MRKTETVTSGWRRISRSITHDTPMPTRVPPAVASTNSPSAWPVWKPSTPAAPTATRNAVSPVASLISDSPWTSSFTRSGTRTDANVATAATASVGATTAPSMNAAGHVSWATSSCEATATTAVVTSTSASASRPSARLSARSSRGDEYQPAESSSGGMKTSSTTCASSSIGFTPGMNEIPSPARTSTIGYGTPTWSAARISSTAANSSAKRSSRSPTERGSLGARRTNS